MTTETDLPTRLYEYTEHYRPNKLMIDAAREIERLRAALQEIADGGWNDPIEPVTLARAALGGSVV